MTPEAARGKILGVKMQTLRWGSYLLRNSPKFKKEGVMNEPRNKNCKNSKIEGHFWKVYTYDPMSPCRVTPDDKLIPMIFSCIFVWFSASKERCEAIEVKYKTQLTEMEQRLNEARREHAKAGE